MPTFRTLTVVEVVSTRPGLQRLVLEDSSRAAAITQLVGEIAVGDEVVVNTTAVDLVLGTGGWHFVQWNLARRELVVPGGGHIMKLRYTGAQLDTGAAEAASTSETVVTEPAGLPRLGGVPVLVGSVHSQVGVAAAMIRSLDPQARVSYVMTDGGALPIVISDLVARLVDRGLLTGTITAGHAFGGDLEAVSVPSALQLAVEVQRADIVICAMGPGVVGTATTLGTSAVEAASVLTVAHQLGTRPVLMVRASDGDGRERHTGISHHSLTALALTPVGVDVPCVQELAETLGDIAPHRRVLVADATVGGVAEVLDRLGVRVTTMGRGPGEDGLFFRTTAAAAAHAVHSRSEPGTVATG